MWIEMQGDMINLDNVAFIAEKDVGKSIGIQVCFADGAEETDVFYSFVNATERYRVMQNIRKIVRNQIGMPSDVIFES